MNKNRVFHYFRQISDIPRGSGNEKAVSDYIKKTAENMGLYTVQDENLNVYVKKPASEGYQNKPGIIIQGHMDMVCEKSTSSDHDFTKDPIKWIEKGDLLYADDTTLGADDAVAVAMALAILEDDSLIHPQLEVIITTEEETEMGGALNLSKDLLEGKYLLNIDSEEEGILTLGSAGGELFTGFLTPEFEDKKSPAVKLEFGGFLGGHSGMEIDKDRKNMVKTIAEFISKNDIKISSLSCGTKENAIPRSGHIIAEKTDDISKLAKDFEKNYSTDEKLEIKISQYEDSALLKKDFQDNFTDFLLKMPTGVNSKDKDFVVSSSNLGVVEFKDEKYHVYDSLRSSVNSILEDMKKNFSSIAKDHNVKYEFSAAYPGWEKKENSKLEKIANDVYERLYGKKFKNIVIHAGLECGAIYEKYPHLEIISFGPDIKGAHTPKENLSISSTNRVYEFTRKLIEEIAKN